MTDKTQTTLSSSRTRAAGIISLFWSKLGHGMGTEDMMAMQDIIAIAIEDSYDAGCEYEKNNRGVPEGFIYQCSGIKNGVSCNYLAVHPICTRCGTPSPLIK